MDLVIKRRQNLFPDLRKIIVDYEVNISGGRLNLNVTSAPVPESAENDDDEGSH